MGHSPIIENAFWYRGQGDDELARDGVVITGKDGWRDEVMHIYPIGSIPDGMHVHRVCLDMDEIAKIIDYVKYGIEQ